MTSTRFPSGRSSTALLALAAAALVARPVALHAQANAGPTKLRLAAASHPADSLRKAPPPPAPAAAAGDSAARRDSQPSGAPRATPPAPAAPAAAAIPVVLRVTGRIQAMYQLTAPDEEADEKLYGSTFSQQQPAMAQSLFRIRRGRLGLEGSVYDPALQYNVQIELAGSAVSLKRGYLNWSPRGAAAQLRAGKFKIPFGRQLLESIFSQELIDRSPVSDEFAKGDDDGLMVWGTPRRGTLEYYAGVFNGEGNNRNSQQDARNLWAARVVWSPLGQFAYVGPALAPSPHPTATLGANATVNGGWLFDLNGVPGIQAPLKTCSPTGCVTDMGDDATVTTLGVDAAAKWRRAAWKAEYFTRRVAPLEDGLRSLRAAGWYTELGVFVLPARLETGARYSAVNLDRGGPGHHVAEASPFANIYIHGNDVKLQLDYAALRTDVVDHRAGSVAGTLTTMLDRRLRAQMLLTF